MCGEVSTGACEDGGGCKDGGGGWSRVCGDSRCREDSHLGDEEVHRRSWKAEIWGVGDVGRCTHLGDEGLLSL